MQLQTSSEFGEPMSKSTYYSGKVTKNFVLLLPLLVAAAYSFPPLFNNETTVPSVLAKITFIEERTTML